MTQEQKRIKLAEACGLKVIDVPFIPSQTKPAGCVFTDAARTAWRKCYPNSCGVRGIPDYFNDLNAVHELEKVLTEKGVNTWWKYADHINRLNPTLFGRETAIHATAAQRCEAIGLTLGLWEQ
jgi:hypothetical protein